MNMFSERILMQGTRNTRDLANLVNRYGFHIRKEKLFRSDALNHITLQDQEELKNKYHLKRVIDLRTFKQIENEPNVRISGVEYIADPVLPTLEGEEKNHAANVTEEDFIELLFQNGLESSGKYMMKIYEMFITCKECQEAYARLIRILLKEVSGVTLWHCSAGKDRAGFATILILYLLNFDWETIVEDYLATNRFYMMTIEDYKKEKGNHYEDILWCIYGVRREYLDVLNQAVEANYGDWEHYISKGLKITQEEISKLREIYLTK